MQEEDDARASRMRGAASASEQAHTLHQEQEAVVSLQPAARFFFVIETDARYTGLTCV